MTVRGVVVGLVGYVAGVASVVGVLATPGALNAAQGRDGGRFWREGTPPVTSKEAPSAPAAPATQLPSLSGLVKTVAPSVVYIRTTRKHPQISEGSPFGPRGPFGRGPMMPPDHGLEGGGSGFVVSEDGYIVTNNHVVAEADEITVQFQDGHEYKARIVGRDPQFDVGLIKIDAKKLPVVTLGDSERLEAGDWVLAVGNPLGLEYSASVGIISGMGRRIGIGRYDSLLQTDAAINPGNSGGPLFNLKGEVVGINTAIIGGANNIGFAVPINMAKEILLDLKEHGRAIRGQLGVQLAPIAPKSKEAEALGVDEGVYLERVIGGTPAEKAGLEPGDVILEYEGEPVKELRDLQRRVARSRPGSEVDITYLRKGKKGKTTAKLVEFREEGLVAQAEPREEEGVEGGEEQGRIGLHVSDVTPDLKKRYDLGVSRGVVVRRVNRGSPAEAAELEEGDLILEADQRKVSDAEEFSRVVKKAGEKPLTLLVERDGDKMFVVVYPKKTQSQR